MNEHEWIKQVKKLEEIFRESFPNGTSQQFVQWLYSTYGYQLK